MNASYRCHKVHHMLCTQSNHGAFLIQMEVAWQTPYLFSHWTERKQDGVPQRNPAAGVCVCVCVCIKGQQVKAFLLSTYGIQHARTQAHKAAQWACSVARFIQGQHWEAGDDIITPATQLFHQSIEKQQWVHLSLCQMAGATQWESVPQIHTYTYTYIYPIKCKQPCSEWLCL